MNAKHQLKGMNFNLCLNKVDISILELYLTKDLCTVCLVNKGKLSELSLKKLQLSAFYVNFKANVLYVSTVH